MFFRPAHPEETGACLLEDVVEGEWLGPINPVDRPPEPVVVEKIVEKVVEKIVEKPVPVQPPEPSSSEPPKESPANARLILEWFINVGTDHFPRDVQGEYVVRLANMLSESLRLGRKFDGVPDVVKFLLENGDH
ncbi:MAG: hypothetical protein HRF44_07740 [Ignavibacterium sp.]